MCVHVRMCACVFVCRDLEGVGQQKTSLERWAVCMFVRGGVHVRMCVHVRVCVCVWGPGGGRAAEDVVREVDCVCMCVEVCMRVCVCVCMCLCVCARAYECVKG